VLVIGTTRHGKSAFGNSYLQRAAFETHTESGSGAHATNVAETIVDGWRRCVIDTPGVDDRTGVDSERTQQMVQFLASYQHGVNVLALVINGQCDRMTTGTEKLIRLLHVFFRDPAFWSHLCIVFTSCIAGRDVDRRVRETKYRDRMSQLAVGCGGESLKASLLPIYCVDSPKWQEDSETSQELTGVHAFAVGLPPLSTNNRPIPHPQWCMIENETREKVQVGSRDEQLSSGAVRVATFQDQERERRTENDGITISYGPWNTVRQWEERRPLAREPGIVITVINQNSSDVFEIRITNGGRPTGEPQETWQEFVGTEITRRFRQKQRVIITGFDGTVSYGDWETIREWEETEFVPVGQRPRANHAGSTGPVAPEQIRVSESRLLHVV
jgi:hypothetical protein